MHREPTMIASLGEDAQLSFPFFQSGDGTRLGRVYIDDQQLHCAQQICSEFRNEVTIQFNQCFSSNGGPWFQLDNVGCIESL